jgi:hypothetical protein
MDKLIQEYENTIEKIHPNTMISINKIDNLKSK